MASLLLCFASKEVMKRITDKQQTCQTIDCDWDYQKKGAQRQPVGTIMIIIKVMMIIVMMMMMMLMM